MLSWGASTEWRSRRPVAMPLNESLSTLGGPKAIYAVLAGDVKRATFVPQCTVDWNRARHNHQFVHQIRCGAFLWVFAGLRTA